MAVAVVQASSKITVLGTAGDVMTFSAPTTKGNLVVVGLIATSPTTVAVSDNKGNTYGTTGVTTADNNGLAVIYDNTTAVQAGVTTITVSCTGTTGTTCNLMAIAVEVKLYQAGQTTSTSANTSATADPGPVTPTTPDSYTMGVLVQTTGGTSITEPTGWTLRASDTTANDADGAVVDKVIHTAAAQDPAWTLAAADQWGAIVATFSGAEPTLKQHGINYMTGFYESLRGRR